MIVQNQLPNCPITIDDAKNMLQAYGPDTAALKGKTTRRTAPQHVASNQRIPLDSRILAAHGKITHVPTLFLSTVSLSS
jgi:hypothetical protein